MCEEVWSAFQICSCSVQQVKVPSTKYLRVVRRSSEKEDELGEDFKKSKKKKGMIDDVTFCQRTDSNTYRYVARHVASTSRILYTITKYDVLYARGARRACRTVLNLLATILVVDTVVADDGEQSRTETEKHNFEIAVTPRLRSSSPSQSSMPAFPPSKKERMNELA
jgi:hypothetical protein